MSKQELAELRLYLSIVADSNDQTVRELAAHAMSLIEADDLAAAQIILDKIRDALAASAENNAYSYV